MRYKSSSIDQRRPKAMVMVWYGKFVLSFRSSMEHSPSMYGYLNDCMCLYVCLFGCQDVSPSVCLSLCVDIRMSDIWVSVWMSRCLDYCHLSVWILVCPSGLVQFEMEKIVWIVKCVVHSNFIYFIFRIDGPLSQFWDVFRKSNVKVSNLCIANTPAGLKFLGPTMLFQQVVRFAPQQTCFEIRS